MAWGRTIGIVALVLVLTNIALRFFHPSLGIIALGFFLLGVGGVFVAVFSKAYKNWKD